MIIGGKSATGISNNINFGSKVIPKRKNKTLFNMKY
jgi:hypothetical protein